MLNLITARPCCGDADCLDSTRCDTEPRCPERESNTQPGIAGQGGGYEEGYWGFLNGLWADRRQEQICIESAESTIPYPRSCGLLF